MNQSGKSRECFYKRKKWGAFLSALFLLFCSVYICPAKIQAGSGTVTFSTRQEQVKKGDIFTVVCQVNTTEDFLNAEFQIEYDTEYLQFISGGSKVSSSGGIVTVVSDGNETPTRKKTFSLQFAALKKGTATIALGQTAKITDANGDGCSVSSNRLIIEVVSKKKAEKKAETTEEPVPVVTPKPVLDKKNSLSFLKVKALEMVPAFSPDVTEYQVRVDTYTDILYVSFVAESDKAIVQLKGMDKLTVGDNEAEVVVTAQNGKKKTYKLHIKKESTLETSQREEDNEKTDKKNIEFSITKKNDKIWLSNQYEFEVLDPGSLTSVPAGYVLSNIELDGIRIPAFTVEKDLANNYLLLYVKGPSKEPALYQYDREEKTLQRYTGSMVEKINNGQIQNKNPLSFNQYVLVGIIVGLVCIVLVLMIAMLKMAIRKKEDDGGLME